MISGLRIPAFQKRFWEVLPRWYWYIYFSFSAHWFLAKHASQPAIPYRSFLESEFECLQRQPDHQPSQGHPCIQLDRKKLLIVCLSVILHWLFWRRSRWEWGKAEEREQTIFLLLELKQSLNSKFTINFVFHGIKI